MTTMPISAAVPAAADLGRPVRILLVEDSEADVRLTMAALRKARVANDLYHVPDGEQAMAFLRKEGSNLEAPRPDLVLLDLNMPRMDGREVLAAMKADPDLRRIPVVVLTTSSEERDIVTSYDNSVAGYVTKPVAFDEFVDVVRSLEGFWLTIVHFSPR
jgi:two-component system, chemotaxis family, response regulator Rcp1